MIDLTKLAAHFSPDAISWRVGPVNSREAGKATKGIALAYLDARDVQDRLTEVCGIENWSVRNPWSVSNKLACEIGIYIERENGVAEWVWKGDGAGESDMEAEKGAFSDSFKRAAVRWGVGRYLYDLDSPWVEIEPMGKSYKIKDSEKPKLRALLERAAKGSVAPAPVAAQRPKPVEAPAAPTEIDGVDVPLILDGAREHKAVPAVAAWINENAGMLGEIAKKTPRAYDAVADGIFRHALSLCRIEKDVDTWVGSKARNTLTGPMSEPAFEQLNIAVSRAKADLKANLRMAG